MDDFSFQSPIEVPPYFIRPHFFKLPPALFRYGYPWEPCDRSESSEDHYKWRHLLLVILKFSCLYRELKVR